MWSLDETIDEGAASRGDVPKSVPARDKTLGAIMEREVVCVPADLDLAAVAALFVQTGLGGAPVVDDAGKVMGMVSRSDLVRYHHELDAPHDGRTSTASDVMTPFLFALPERATVCDAAALMSAEGVHRLAVMRGAEMVGVVSALDVMRWLSSKEGSQRRPLGHDRSSTIAGRA